MDLFREWEKDRKEEAWDAIHQIVEWVEDKDTEDIYKYYEIKKILKEGGWI